MYECVALHSVEDVDAAAEEAAALLSKKWPRSLGQR